MITHRQVTGILNRNNICMHSRRAVRTGAQSGDGGIDVGSGELSGREETILDDMFIFYELEDHSLVGVIGVKCGNLLRTEEGVLNDMVLLHILHDHGFIRIIVWGVWRDVGREGDGRLWRVHHLVWYDVYMTGTGDV